MNIYDERPKGAVGMGDWQKYQANFPKHHLVVDGYTHAVCASCNGLCNPLPTDHDVKVGAIVITPFIDTDGEERWRWIPVVVSGSGCTGCRGLFLESKQSTPKNRTPFINMTDLLRDWVRAGRPPFTPHGPVEETIQFKPCDYCNNPSVSEMISNSFNPRTKEIEELTHNACARHALSLIHI